MNPRTFIVVVLMAVLTIPATLWGAVTECHLRKVDGGFKGQCSALLDQKPSIDIAREKAITTGVWDENVRPRSAWMGHMSDSDYGSAPVEMEVDAGGAGVLRTIYGWFPVSGFQESAGSMRFSVDASHEVAPSELDRQIVRRAASMLKTEAAWNRSDNRKCPQGATRWSIYCAMEKATIEVAGAFSHRRPAMEVVRQIIDERTAGRPYHHRLMDYNNDPSTRLADVQSLFAEALARMNH